MEAIIPCADERALMHDTSQMVLAHGADRACAHARTYIRGLQGRLRKKGIRVHEHVVLNPIVRMIVDLAMREEVDLWMATANSQKESE
jgi:hypothetical protein